MPVGARHSGTWTEWAGEGAASPWLHDWCCAAPGPLTAEEAPDLGFSMDLLCFKCWKLIFKNREKQQDKTKSIWVLIFAYRPSIFRVSARREEGRFSNIDMALAKSRQRAGQLQAIWFGGSTRERSCRAVCQAWHGCAKRHQLLTGACISVHIMMATEWNEALHHATALSCPPHTCQCEGPAGAGHPTSCSAAPQIKYTKGWQPGLLVRRTLSRKQCQVYLN